MDYWVRLVVGTIIKMAATIFTLYLIFNITTLTITHVRMLGCYYTVCQTVVANGYIPNDEFDILEEYLEGIDTACTSNIQLVYREDSSQPYRMLVKGAGGTRFTSNDDYLDGNYITLNRRQYGTKIDVGISYRFHLTWPLMNKEQLEDPNAGFRGYWGTGNGGNSELASTTEINQRRENKRTSFVVTIANPVPSLKYYQDLV